MVISFVIESAQEVSKGHFTCSIDTNGYRGIGISFEFDPRAAIRNDGSVIDIFTGLVDRFIVVRARGAN